MSRAARMVWEQAGQPAPSAVSVAKLLTDTPAVCAMCSTHSDITASADRALGQNFADRSLFENPNTGRICPGCLWACSGKPPASLRMWSIICAPGHALPPSSPKAYLQHPAIFLHNRAAGRVFGEFLASPADGPWVMSIALSAQKHVLPYAEINHGSGPWTVRVEDHTVTSTPTQWAAVREHARAIRALGVPEAAVLDGHPAFIKNRDQLNTWTQHNRHLTRFHRSPLLAFALWTITKETLTCPATP